MVVRRPRKKVARSRSRLQSSLSILPSLFTIGNIFCGYYSLVATLKGNYDSAAIAIGLGFVMDGLDGRIARLTKTTSDFGVQLDSLADVLTFGIAPALLAFRWGLGSIDGNHSQIAEHVRQFAWLATFVFLICGALRLARFNIQSQRPPEMTSKRYFVGLPIPMGAGLIAAIVHYFEPPVLRDGSAFLWYVLFLWYGLILLTSVLMISTVRYNSFKELNLMKYGPRVPLVIAAVVLGLVIFYSGVMLLVLTVVYVSSGPISKIEQVARRLLSPKVPPIHSAQENLKP